MPFVRFTTDFFRTKWVKELAADLNIRPAQAVGHAVALASAMATEAPTGSLEGVPTFLIAEWAEWSEGAADFVRILFQVWDDDRFPDWDSINQPQREARSSTERQRRIRQKRTGVTPNIPISNGVPSSNIITNSNNSDNKSNTGGNGVTEPHVTGLFQLAWDQYPVRAGGNSRTEAEKAFRKRIAEGVDPWAMVEGTRRYAIFCNATNRTGTEYVKQAATFFGPNRHWEDEFKLPTKPAGKPAPQQYSYGEPVPSSPQSATTGELGRPQFAGVFGYDKPQLVGRQGPFEITEPDTAAEPEPSPYGRRVE